MKNGKKKIAPIKLCKAVINKAENFSVKYLATIVYPAPQIIAQNSKEFPKKGFGAEAVVVASKLNQTAPITAIEDPKINCLEINSFRKNPAPIAVISGIIEVIIPACEAVVFCRAFASKIKYKQGSNRANKRIYFKSSFVNVYFKKDFIKYKKQALAISILKNITEKGPISPIADFKAIKELAQINIAKTSVKIPIILNFVCNSFLLNKGEMLTNFI